MQNEIIGEIHEILNNYLVSINNSDGTTCKIIKQDKLKEISTKIASIV